MENKDRRRLKRTRKKHLSEIVRITEREKSYRENSKRKLKEKTKIENSERKLV